MVGTRTSQKPTGALTIETYSDLDRYVRGFAEGHFGLTIIVAAAGLQKSEAVRRSLGENACYLQGRVTAFEMYRELFRHRDERVVIDDVDDIYQNPQAVRLLRSLCQTEAVKTVAWHSSTRILDEEAIPRRFETSSQVLIVANAWSTRNASVKALEDRGHMVFFEPTPAEIHRRTAEWFREAEIYEFVGKHLHLVKSLSMRDYQIALEAKVANLDWHHVLLNRILQCSARRLLADRLMNDTSFHTEEDRARAFMARGGGCRATYFNHTQRLRLQITTEVRCTENCAAPPDPLVDAAQAGVVEMASHVIRGGIDAASNPEPSSQGDTPAARRLVESHVAPGVEDSATFLDFTV